MELISVFKAFNCKASQLKICIIFCQTRPGSIAQMSHTAVCSETRGNGLSSCSSRCGLLLTLRITLHYKHSADGSGCLLRNRPISTANGCMRNHRIGGKVVNYASMSIFILILICDWCADPSRNHTRRSCVCVSEDLQEFERLEVEQCLCQCRERFTDPAGTQSEILLICISNHSDWTLG